LEPLSCNGLNGLYLFPVTAPNKRPKQAWQPLEVKLVLKNNTTRFATAPVDYEVVQACALKTKTKLFKRVR
jgi:hypothetical protein